MQTGDLIRVSLTATNDYNLRVPSFRGMRISEENDFLAGLLNNNNVQTVVTDNGAENIIISESLYSDIEKLDTGCTPEDLLVRLCDKYGMKALLNLRNPEYGVLYLVKNRENIKFFQQNGKDTSVIVVYPKGSRLDDYCPSVGILRAIVWKGLDVGEMSYLGEHLTKCPSCQQFIDEEHAFRNLMISLKNGGSAVSCIL